MVSISTLPDSAQDHMARMNKTRVNSSESNFLTKLMADS